MTYEKVSLPIYQKKHFFFLPSENESFRKEKKEKRTHTRGIVSNLRLSIRKQSF